MVKISRLEIENVKKVRAVEITPSETGLTTIGGKNAQGKTSILDAIAYALGGERYRPSNLQREGSVELANIKVRLSNGLIVERSGKNATLKVTDPTGARSGQRLLDSFIEELALNLPKFMAMNDKDKAQVLLTVLGLEEELRELEEKEQSLYNQRHAQGRVADQKRKFALEMPEWHDVPSEYLSSASLIAELQAVAAQNARNQEKRNQISDLERALNRANEINSQKSQRVQEIEAMLKQAEKEKASAEQAALEAAERLDAARAQGIQDDVSTHEIERKLSEIEEINSKVRANKDKQKAVLDADSAKVRYDDLTRELEKAREEKLSLLDSADLPLPGLGIVNSELTYNGQKWDCMSSAEQVKVAVAIVKQRNPECGFVLLDRLEVFDSEQLRELSNWLESENLQAIATRVSVGDECTIIIEDGLIAASN